MPILVSKGDEDEQEGRDLPDNFEGSLPGPDPNRFYPTGGGRGSGDRARTAPPDSEKKQQAQGSDSNTDYPWYDPLGLFSGEEDQATGESQGIPTQGVLLLGAALAAVYITTQ
jgi:hypothetical protein